MKEVKYQVEKLQKIINNSENIVFFGGAGVSTESGIPDFRSVDGLYHQEWDYPPEVIISHSFFEANPKEFYRFYKAKLLPKGIFPNMAHKKLAEMEKVGKLKAIVTQNIDGLHQDAGSKVVYELHGSVLRNYCTKCGEFFDVDFIRNSLDLPICTKCGGLVKPDVVLYEEGLDDNVISASVEAISKADCLIIGGTSLTVQPAASLVRYFAGKYLVVINKGEVFMPRGVDLIIREKIGEVLGKIVAFF
jgi:NAD-dependent deacetylase